MAVVGFDFGTTNSVISVIRGGRAVTYLDDQGLPIPSVVCYEGARTIVGREARERVGQTGLGVHGNVVRSPKTMIGRDSVFVGGVERSPVDIVRDVVEFVRHEAQESTVVPGTVVERAVVTIPVDMDGRRRALLRDAFRMAGVSIIRFVHEPLAALYAHLRSTGDLDAALRLYDRQLFIVLDWGGGTLDLTLCRLIDGLLIQVGNDGTDEVGGDLFDAALRDEVERRFRTTRSVPDDVRAQAGARTRLMHHCERAKIDLSSRPNARLFVPNFFEGLEDPDLELALTRDDFDSIVRQLLDKGLTRIEQLLESNGFSPSSVAMCLATGGMANMPAIKSRLNEYFGPQRVHVSERSASLISEGAAWIAHDGAKLHLAKNVELVLARNSHMQLLNAGLEMPHEGEVRREQYTLYCVDPSDGRGKFELVSPHRPGPQVNRGDSRRHLANLVVKVDRHARPFRERLVLDIEIDENLILRAKARASNLGDASHAEVHDLEFALAFPQAAKAWLAGKRIDGDDVSSSFASGTLAMRSNIAASEDWDLVPGEVLYQIDPRRLDRGRNAPEIQIEEKLYYSPCSMCGRRSNDPDCRCSSQLSMT